MAKRTLPKIKVPKVRKPATIPPPSFRSEPTADNAEVLTGMVQGMKASAPEERLFRALSKSGKVKGTRFRYTVGAPRGLPGWKEVDALVEANGLIYAMEVDTVFTHRKKKEADRLHDAIVLNELEKQGMAVYPQVIHVDGDGDLADQKNADATVQRMFG